MHFIFATFEFANLAKNEKKIGLDCGIQKPGTKKICQHSKPFREVRGQFEKFATSISTFDQIL